jgi:hypothetical protein
VTVRALRSELRKALHLNGVRLAALVAVVLAAVVSGHDLLANSSASASPGAAAASADGALQSAAVAEVLAALAGIVVATAETSSRTLAITLSLVPRRRAVFAAKWLVALLVCGGIAVAALVGAALGGIIETAALPSALPGRPTPSTIVARVPHVLPAVLAATLLVGLLWAAVASLARLRTPVLGGYVVYAFGLTNAVALSSPAVARWLPEGAAQGLTRPVLMVQIGWHTASGHPLTAAPAAVYLATLVVVTTAGALAAFAHRDVVQ